MVAVLRVLRAEEDRREGDLASVLGEVGARDDRRHELDRAAVPLLHGAGGLGVERREVDDAELAGEVADEADRGRADRGVVGLAPLDPRQRLGRLRLEEHGALGVRPRVAGLEGGEEVGHVGGGGEGGENASGRHCGTPTCSLGKLGERQVRDTSL